MKMKRYIAAGILATALLASGCGKFVRDELITMQNEIDQLTKKVSQMMNQDLAALSEVVTQMENGGYVTSADSFTDEEGRGGIVLNAVRYYDVAGVHTVNCNVDDGALVVAGTGFGAHLFHEFGVAHGHFLAVYGGNVQLFVRFFGIFDFVYVAQTHGIFHSGCYP